LNTATPDIRPSLTGTWELDPVHSSVKFEVPYLTGRFKGEFRDVAARLTVDAHAAALAGTAKVESVEVKDENLEADLLSPQFFDAERHPELRFGATEIELDSGSISATGGLTIKGVTRPVEVTGTLTAPIVDAFSRKRIGLSLTTTVNRHDFGVSWNVPLPSGEPAVGDDVTIVAELYFVEAT
jgi:polyisoprenoid-binding protein YceI